MANSLKNRVAPVPIGAPESPPVYYPGDVSNAAPSPLVRDALNNWFMSPPKVGAPTRVGPSASMEESRTLASRQLGFPAYFAPAGNANEYLREPTYYDAKEPAKFHESVKKSKVSPLALEALPALPLVDDSNTVSVKRFKEVPSEEWAKSSYWRGGILPYIGKNFLFAVDSRTRVMTDFGGHREKSDKDIVGTAIREATEESFGLLGYSRKDIEDINPIVIYDGKRMLMLLQVESTVEDVITLFGRALLLQKQKNCRIESEDISPVYRSTLNILVKSNTKDIIYDQVKVLLRAYVGRVSS